MIEIKNVSVDFGKGEDAFKAVDDVSLTIDDGDVYGIIGASGAGKSTLVRTINALQKVSSGEVLVDGVNIAGLGGSELRKVRQGIGMIFQHFNLIGNKTVFDNVAFPLRAAGKSKPQVRERVMELLDYVGLGQRAQEYPGKLSGGQKQRVAIARALANDARILLCDEPTSALDAETTASVLELIKSINAELGVTVVIITHELGVVKEICNRVTVMDRGRAVETGDVYELFARPKEAYTRELIEKSRRSDLPKGVLEAEGGPIWRLTFADQYSESPLITDTAKRFDVDFNVIHGQIDYIEGKALGIIYVSVMADAAKVSRIRDYMKQRVQDLEVVRDA